MSFKKIGVKVKLSRSHLIAVIRANVQARWQVAELIEELSSKIPSELITGPPFWVRHFIHSYPEGFDVEVGYPVRERITAGRVQTRQLPEYAVLTKTHQGDASQLGDIYQQIFTCQDTYGLISDEFCIEILHDHNPLSGKIEVQMVIHPWQELFSQHLKRVMGKVVHQSIMDGDSIFVDSSVDQRFAWTKAAIDRLDQVSSSEQRYEILSNCSHVFPWDQANKLRTVYQSVINEQADMLKAVDAVLNFMQEDPGWRQKIYRDGRILFTIKNPRDPDTYAKATTDLERKQAYCFCPIVRQHLEDGISSTFCYCSAGFERKQWEVVLNQPVRIEIVESLLKGHQQCQFAIHLPVEEIDEDLA